MKKNDDGTFNSGKDVYTADLVLIWAWLKHFLLLFFFLSLILYIFAGGLPYLPLYSSGAAFALSIVTMAFMCRGLYVVVTKDFIHSSTTNGFYRRTFTLRIEEIRHVTLINNSLRLLLSGGGYEEVYNLRRPVELYMRLREGGGGYRNISFLDDDFIPQHVTLSSMMGKQSKNFTLCRTCANLLADGGCRYYDIRPTSLHKDHCEDYRPNGADKN